tara:strand:- start:201 stop:383 length:183 start_codon:yes stop_codon:yes gene_type:complete
MRENMTDFTIKEYNFKTKEYTHLGYSEGKDATEAKQNFIDQTGWKSTKSTALFARIPLCR